MKRISVLFILSIAFLQAFPDSLDSLKVQRDRLYEKYSDINLPGKTVSYEDKEKSLQILKDVVIVDTKIIKELSEYGDEIKTNESKINALITQNNSLTDELSAATDRLFIIYITVGLIVCMLVISLVLLMAYHIKYKKLKKLNVNFNEMLRSADNDRALLQKLNETMLEKEQELSGKNTLLAELQKEKEVLENKLTDIKSQKQELQQQPPTAPPLTGPELEQFNINLAKIEKLGRMLELGIVTEDEFKTFKRKFLGDL